MSGKNRTLSAKVLTVASADQLASCRSLCMPLKIWTVRLDGMAYRYPFFPSYVCASNAFFHHCVGLQWHTDHRPTRNRTEKDRSHTNCEDSTVKVSRTVGSY
jgi:hypothetical protein